MLSDANIIAITDHITRYIGAPTHVLHELIPQELHVDIHIVAPTKDRDFYTVVTSGMSERAMPVPEGSGHLRFAELMICLPATWPMEEKDRSSEEFGW